jgi:hypothetical protein
MGNFLETGRKGKHVILSASIPKKEYSQKIKYNTNNTNLAGSLM